MKLLLKKAALISAGMLFISLANATKHVVTVQNFSFAPSSFSAVIGDTVEWDWVGGSHTTTSTSVPGGAATWSNPMNSGSTTFQYKITTAGTYNYWCAIHTTMMEASFTVAVTGLPTITSPKPIAKIYPNPAKDVLNIHLNISPNTNVLIISDIQGKEVLRETLSSEDNAINISEWKKGIYFYSLKDGTELLEGKFEVE